MGLRRTLFRARGLIARAVFVVTAQTLYWVAALWRRALVRTTFIAVTGSHGKTTTKELLATVLESWRPTFRSFLNENTGLSLTLNVLRVRPRHRYAVIEIGVGAPGEMWRLARLVRPDVAVVLTVLRVHTKAFADQEQHAAEKAGLLEALRPGGVAVLNADDPRVARMAEAVRGTVVRFGTSATLDVWAEGATSRWPQRLELEVHARGGESCHVRTLLVGTHWVASVTAALATARALGLPFREAAAALAAAEPALARMQPVRLPAGAVILRDDYDGSFETFTAALAVLGGARAARRVAVISDVSDFGSTMRRKRLAHLGREAARVADVVVFTGEAAAYGARGAIKAGMAPDAVHAFVGLPETAELLRRTLRPDDLVLLKGRITDHVTRLFFAQLGPIACWKVDCGKLIACDVCPELGSAPEHRALALPVAPPHP